MKQHRSFLQRLRAGLAAFAAPLALGGFGLGAGALVSLHHNSAIVSIPRAATPITAVAVGGGGYFAAFAAADGEIEIRVNNDANRVMRIANPDGAVTSLAFGQDEKMASRLFFGTALGKVRAVSPFDGAGELADAFPISAAPAFVAHDPASGAVAMAGVDEAGAPFVALLRKGETRATTPRLDTANFGFPITPGALRVVSFSDFPAEDEYPDIFDLVVASTAVGEATLRRSLRISLSPDGADWRIMTEDPVREKYFAGDMFAATPLPEPIALFLRGADNTLIGRDGAVLSTSVTKKLARGDIGRLPQAPSAATIWNNRIVIGLNDGRVQTIDADTLDVRATYKISNAPITHLAREGDTLAVAAADGAAAMLNLWPVQAGLYGGLPGWRDRTLNDALAQWTKLISALGAGRQDAVIATGPPGPGPVLRVIGRTQPRTAEFGGSAIVLLSAQEDLVSFNPAFCSQLALALSAEATVNGGEVSRPVYWPVTSPQENAQAGPKFCDRYVGDYDFTRARVIRDKHSVRETSDVQILILDAQERLRGQITIPAVTAGEPIDKLINVLRVRMRCQAEAWTSTAKCPPRGVETATFLNVPATQFTRGQNVAIDACTPGPGILTNARPCNETLNAAEFDITAPTDGLYQLEIEYAAGVARPIRVLVNGAVVAERALNDATGGWDNANLTWGKVASVALKAGVNVVRLEGTRTPAQRTDKGLFPHIRALQLTRVGNAPAPTLPPGPAVTAADLAQLSPKAFGGKRTNASRVLARILTSELRPGGVDTPARVAYFTASLGAIAEVPDNGKALSAEAIDNEAEDDLRRRLRLLFANLKTTGFAAAADYGDDQAAWRAFQTGVKGTEFNVGKRADFDAKLKVARTLWPPERQLQFTAQKYLAPAASASQSLSQAAVPDAPAQNAIESPAGPAAPAHTFTINYAIRVRGIIAGDFTFSMGQDSGLYDARAYRRATGIARAMLAKSQDFTYTASGKMTATGPQPLRYEHSGGKNGRVVKVAFSANDSITTAVPEMGMGNPPATKAQRSGAIDQVSMFVALVTASGDPCARTLPVFMDGRMRFDFAMRPAGKQKMSSKAWKGEAFRCAVRFMPIAGFADPQEAADLTILMAPLNNGLYAPVQIEMPSEEGMITLEAKSLKVG